MKPLVVVPNYVTNMEDLSVLETCLSSLRFTAKDACDVLVVDDGSPAQDVVEGCRGLAEHFDCEFVAKEENTGFAATVNVGLRKALNEGRDAVLCNADIEFIRGASTWLDLMVRQAGVDGVTPAAMVGALLLYPNNTIQHAGIYFSILYREFDHVYRYGPHNLPEARHARVLPVTGALQFIRSTTLEKVGVYDETFCSPGDEMVLTARDGYVPLGELRGDQGLVTVDHSAAGGRITRGRGSRWAPAGGHRARRVSREFAGELIVLQAGRATAKVTPGHRLRVRWTERALASYAVYLMQRGRDWRIGVAGMSTRAARTFGPRVRQVMEGGDAVWLLEICATRLEAELMEATWSLDYGIPQMVFRSKEGARRTQRRVDEFWAGRDSRTGARRLLVDRGLYETYPLLGGPGAGYCGGAYHGFLVHAANVVPDMMTVGTDPGRGNAQRRELVGVDREAFVGRVYSLDVPPHHYYVSGGMVVHNSLGWEDVDYNVRAWLAGLEIIYQPAVRAYHHEGFFRGSGRNDPTSKVAQWQSMSWHRFKEKWGDTNFAEFIPSLL